MKVPQQKNGVYLIVKKKGDGKNLKILMRVDQTKFKSGHRKLTKFRKEKPNIYNYVKFSNCTIYKEIQSELKKIKF